MLPTRPAMVISASPYYHIWVQAYKPFELLSHGGFGDRELVLSQKVGESEKGRAGRDSRFNHSVFCSRRASKTCCPVKVVPHVGQAQVLVFNSAFTSVVFSTVRPIAAFSAAGSGRGLPTLLLKVQVRMLCPTLPHFEHLCAACGRLVLVLFVCVSAFAILPLCGDSI